MTRDERLRRYFHDRPCLIGYVLLILFCLIAVGLYQNHINAQLDRTDRNACLARNAIASNQVLVLKTLLDVERRQREADPAKAVALQSALANAGPREC